MGDFAHLAASALNYVPKQVQSPHDEMSSFTGDLSMVEREDRVAVQRSANIISKTEYLPSLPIPKWSSGPRSREELSMDRRQLGVQLSDLKPRIMVSVSR